MLYTQEHESKRKIGMHKCIHACIRERDAVEENRFQKRKRKGEGERARARETEIKGGGDGRRARGGEGGGAETKDRSEIRR